MKDFDLNSQSEEIGIDKSALLSLYYIYINETEKDMKELFSLVEKRDIGEVRNLAHHIKGASLNLEINTLVEDSRFIETLCDGQAEWRDIHSACRALNEHFDKLKVRIAEAESNG